MKKEFCENQTVGYLLEFIKKHNIPKDAIIFSERITDSYYERGWGSVKKENEEYLEMKEYKETCFIPQEVNMTDEELEFFKDEFSPIWCPTVYEDDKNLYLRLHY